MTGRPADFLDCIMQVASAYPYNSVKGSPFPDWFQAELDKNHLWAWYSLLGECAEEIKRSRARGDEGMRLLAGRLLSRLAGDAMPAADRAFIDRHVALMARELAAMAREQAK